jgi:hypothetical protein
MCDPATAALVIGVAGAATSAYGSYKEGQATKQANGFQAGIYQNNAVTAKQNASNERQSGIEDARRVRIQTIQKMSMQKAAMAANGLDINEGTAVDLTADTASMGELDALTTMHNSELKARNYENTANDFTSQAQLSLISGKNAATSGLIKGLGNGMASASQVSGKWSNYNKPAAATL